MKTPTGVIRVRKYKKKLKWTKQNIAEKKRLSKTNQLNSDVNSGTPVGKAHPAPLVALVVLIWLL
jgi:hypothetical protein